MMDGNKSKDILLLVNFGTERQMDRIGDAWVN